MDCTRLYVISFVGKIPRKYYLCISDLSIVQVMFIMATVSCTLVILSLVHFLMALSANYAHIRGHDKFTDLQVVF